MPFAVCTERQVLARAVVDAVSTVYKAKAALDSAKEERGATNVDSLSAALQQARDAERAATRALDDHRNSTAARRSFGRQKQKSRSRVNGQLRCPRSASSHSVHDARFKLSAGDLN